MVNTTAVAERWTRFLASRSYVPRGEVLLKHFERGKITRLCGCGCNSFDFAVETSSDLEPLVASAGYDGGILMLAFYVRDRSEPKLTVEITVFANPGGYLSGIDIDFCGNSMPMPEFVDMEEPPFHVVGLLAA